MPTATSRARSRPGPRRFWSAVGTGLSAAPGEGVDDLAPTVRVENANLAGPAAHTFPDRTRLDQDSFLAPVTVNRELQTAGSTASTHHLEITLPAGIAYKAGDHLGVFPRNPADIVAAIAERCRLDLSATVVLSPSGAGAPEDQGLPFAFPIAVGDLLENYVDLTGPVTRRDLRAWAKTADCPPDKARLQGWLADVPGLVGGRKPRLTDLLAEVPSVRLDLATLLTTRPTLKPRYYSISSSPLLAPEHCSITVGVQHFKGADGVDRKGLCSSFLADTLEGASLRVVVKDTGSTFRLPEDPRVPIILVGPGTGLAPLRGFLQERHALRARGITVVAACSSSAAAARRIISTARNSKATRRRAPSPSSRSASRAPAGSAEDLRAGSDPRPGPARRGSARGRRLDLRLRQRPRHGPRRPQGLHRHRRRRRRDRPPRFRRPLSPGRLGQRLR